MIYSIRYQHGESNQSTMTDSFGSRNGRYHGGSAATVGIDPRISHCIPKLCSTVLPIKLPV